MVAPVTANVPATEVLPVAAVIVNLLVLTATSPETAKPAEVIVPLVLTLVILVFPSVTVFDPIPIAL